MPLQTSFFRRIFPLAASQFFGVFNDNAYKMLAILAVLGNSGNYFRDSLFLLLITFTYVFPFLILAAPAGSLSDRLPKRYVILLMKLLELVILGGAVLAFSKFEEWGPVPLVIVMLLMASQSAFFSPALNGILPETFHEKDLSHANGNIGMVSFLGAIGGIGVAPFIKSMTGGDLPLCAVFLCISSFLGLLISAKILHVPYQRAKVKGIRHRIFRSLKDGYREVTSRRAMLLAVLGDAFFLGIGVAVQSLLILFAKYTLKDGGGELELGLLQLVPAFGMGVGCYLAGRLSGSKIELGLVPFGAAGVAITLPLAAYFPGAATILNLSAPHFVSGSFSLSVYLHIPAMIWLFLCGISGGLFIVPIRAFFQQRVNPAARGAAMAFSNAVCFLSILLTSLLIFVFALGTAKNDPDIPRVFCTLAEKMPTLTPEFMLTLIGIVTFLVTLYTMWLLPNFAFRFLIITLMHTIYRIRVTGAEHIPERGPALLLSNHVSFIDGILINACTSRMIRFLMHEDYYKHPLINPIARLTGFIEVPANGKHKSMALMFDSVKEALRKGHLVCIFPEGKITRNGLMDEFRGGFGKMLPEDVDVPIIPVRLGMVWGSIFSYYYGKIKMRFPSELPHPVSVTFGKPLPCGVDAFQVRQAIQELGAETDMHSRSNERPLHYQLAKYAKRIPFRKLIHDYDGNSLNAFQVFVRSVLLSWEIRGMVDSDCKYVGVLLPNCSAAALSILGILYADKVPAPLNFTTPPDTLAASVKKAKITHVITSRKFLARLKMEPTSEMVFLEDIAAGIPSWKKIVVVLGTVILPHQEMMNLVSPLTHRDVFGTAALLFSSGSTGIPKGVLLSHHNLDSDIYAFIKVMGWSSKDIVLGNLPLFHSFGLNTCFWLPLIVGCEVVYVPSPLDAAAVGNAVQKYNVSILLSTPTFMQSYMKKCPPEQFKSVRLAIAGAEKLRTDISAKFSDIHDGNLALIEGYGCTELSPVVSINVGNSILDLGKIQGKPGSIGAPMPGICVKIADPMTFKPLPPETEGLLMVKGPIVMQGYLDDPELTAEAIKDGWYNTGDIAKVDVDGYITICGRLSRFSKIGGEMVPHELVECAINEICGLDQRVAAVSGMPDKIKGEVLVVLYTKEMPFTPDSIVVEMRAKHISNLWIPKTANFYPVEHLPLLGSGKLDLRGLRKMVDEIHRRS